MEGLFVLGALLVVSIPVALLYLLISNASLRRRMTEMELILGRQSLEALTQRPVRPVTQATPEPAATKAPWGPATKDAKQNAPQPSDKVPEPAPEPTGPLRAVVFTRTKLQGLIAWATENWFYVVSAISLALAGIFLVQYSIEEGLLPPTVRVALGFAFGIALVAAGEYIRRRFGDSEDSSTAYLPSTFTSAGIVTLFGVILAARVLYDIIGPEVALIGMVLVGAGALVLGWFYGPLLAAVGIIGAILAPFFVGGSSENPTWLFGYFGIITTVGLAIDTVRRWAWVSVISLILGFGAAFAVMTSARLTEPTFMIYCAILALLAIAVPVLRAVPNHGGTLLSPSYIARKSGEAWPEFPTRLAGGSVLTATALILLTSVEASRADVLWTSIAVLAGLTFALLIWARNAPALTDLAALPAIGFVLVVASGTQIWRPLSLLALEPEAAFPTIIPILVGTSLMIAAAAAWRSLRGGQARVFVTIGAVLFAPTVAIVMEVIWQPAETIGAYAWALHAMAIAALMVVLAERFARADGPEHRLRMSLAVLSALASVAFGMVILFSTSALTLALGVTVVGAALLDRQFNLPLMGTYILAGIVTIGFRLVVDPGWNWAVDASTLDLALSHGGAVLAFGAAWFVAKSAGRPRSEVLLESAFVSASGILISVVLYRAIIGWGGSSAVESHWSFGLNGTVWLLLGLTQLRRLSLGGALGNLRIGLAAVFLVLTAGQFFAAATALNPALQNLLATTILGPPLVNTLLIAYLLPALSMYLGMRWVTDLDARLRLGLQVTAAALAALWLALSIRHFWRGPQLMALPDMEQPELYSYTVALLVIGALIFYRALARRGPILRKLGLAVIGLAVAKVFLIDIAGLGGLIRVFALLLLGLALAGLAWLNRWATGKAEHDET